MMRNPGRTRHEVRRQWGLDGTETRSNAALTHALQQASNQVAPADRAMFDEELGRLLEETDNESQAATLFRFRFGKDLVGHWSVAEIRELWKHLSTLPAGHVAGNPNLTRYTRAQRHTTGGEYFGHNGEVKVDYGPNSDLTYGGQEAQLGDPLRGTKASEQINKHETGHSVDQNRSYSTTFNPADWQEHTTNDVIPLFVGALVPNAADQQPATAVLTQALVMPDQQGRTRPYPSSAADLRSTLAAALNDASQDAELLRMMPAIGLTPDQTAALAAADGAAALGLLNADGSLNDANLDAFVASRLGQALIAAKSTPWLENDGGASKGLLIGGRIYQYDGDDRNNPWHSYDQLDRAYKVSNFQYRSPAEWFAEHYAAYYIDDSKAAFRSKDEFTYNFFDAWVNADLAPPRGDWSRH